MGSYPLECPLEAVSDPLENAECRMQNEECRAGLPLRPISVGGGAPGEPAFCVGSNQGAKESELLPDQTERTLHNWPKLRFDPFSGATLILNSLTSSEMVFVLFIMASV